MESPAYIAKLDELGLNVPDDVARDYRAFLLNPEATFPYLKSRMDLQKPDLKWIDKVSVGSKERQAMEASGAEKDEIIAKALQEGRKILEPADERESLERLALWCDSWLGEKGKVSFRNTINARVHYLRKRREVISIHMETFERLQDMQDKIDDVGTYDDAIRFLMSYYQEATGTVFVPRKTNAKK